jgi:hypothetical protein
VGGEDGRLGPGFMEEVAGEISEGLGGQALLRTRMGGASGRDASRICTTHGETMLSLAHLRVEGLTGSRDAPRAVKRDRLQATSVRYRRPQIGPRSPTGPLGINLPTTEGGVGLAKNHSVPPSTSLILEKLTPRAARSKP